MGVQLTLGEMKNALNSVLRETDISEGAAILWVDLCVEGDQYYREFGVMPGTVLLGVEYFRNDELIRGTIQLNPPKQGILN